MIEPAIIGMILAVLLAGLAIGAVAMDWKNREKLANRLESWQADSKSQLQQIAEVHNGLMGQVGAMQDAVTKHEMMLGMKSGGR